MLTAVGSWRNNHFRIWARFSVAKELLIPAERIERSILLIRGQKVMLDRDLAELYGVPTKALNQAVRRNVARFPDDFMFQLSGEEFENWRSQIVTSNSGAKMGIRRRPYVFTEQGVAMLSSVLNSDRAIEVNIAIMRAFVRLREILATHKDLAAKLDELERKLGEHDKKFQIVFEAIRQLMAPPPPAKKRRIGFLPDADDDVKRQIGGQAKRKRAEKVRQ
jgi:hypothetical protein